jgi:hypothetical protein
MNRKKQSWELNDTMDRQGNLTDLNNNEKTIKKSIT